MVLKDVRLCAFLESRQMELIFAKSVTGFFIWSKITNEFSVNHMWFIWWSHYQSIILLCNFRCERNYAGESHSKIYSHKTLVFYVINVLSHGDFMYRAVFTAKSSSVISWDFHGWLVASRKFLRHRSLNDFASWEHVFFICFEKITSDLSQFPVKNSLGPSDAI